MRGPRSHRHRRVETCCTCTRAENRRLRAIAKADQLRIQLELAAYPTCGREGRSRWVVNDEALHESRKLAKWLERYVRRSIP